jgi:hypothetical protein
MSYCAEAYCNDQATVGLHCPRHQKLPPPVASVPPPSDVARLRVALWKIAGHLGIDLDSSMTDDQTAELIEHRIALEIKAGSHVMDPVSNKCLRCNLLDKEIVAQQLQGACSGGQ